MRFLHDPERSHPVNSGSGGNAQTKVIMFGLVTVVLTMASLAFTLARFT
ncbi:MAG: hypothetical protein M3N37_08820 [Actinomycetota bacterium]|nr:hypothetical protein [Actinomycetota bacterium]